MKLVDLDTKVTTWNYDFDKEEYVAVQTTVGEMIDLNTHEGLSIPIIEIPEPHGRLIDVDYADDYAHDELELANSYLTGWEAARAMQKIYQNAPVIIPASEEG